MTETERRTAGAVELSASIGLYREIVTKRVLFVIPPPVGDMAANHEGSSGMGVLRPVNGDYAYPPHTVAVCAGAARADGWSVEIADGAGRQPAEMAHAIGGSDAAVIAIQVAAATFDADLTFLRILRHKLGRVSRAPRVLLFGPSAGRVGTGWEDAADGLLTGEPDAAIAGAMAAVSAGATGILAAAELEPGAYTPSGLLRDLDRPPFPAWDLVPWQPYGMTSLLSSRGCPAGCRYCAYTLTQGDIFRAQSVERTAAEWAWLAAQIRPPSLVVRDPVFAHDRGRVAAICESLAGGKNSRNLLPWACESRPEHFDRALIREMAAAGCATIKIGMESGDGAFLAGIGRLATAGAGEEYLMQVVRVSRWCEEAGVRCRVFVMAGLPGQGAADSPATVAALKRLAPSAVIHASAYRAYDGVALDGCGQPVQTAALDLLRSANRPAPPLLRRAARFARRRVRALSAPRPGGNPVAAPVVPAEPQKKMRECEYLLAGSRVFLTGGSGFVGGYVARALVDAGAEVFALLRPGAPPGALAQLPLHFVRGDLTELASWSEALRGCRFCFHIAALYAGADRASAMIAVNARATGALVAACAGAGVARFIHTSTIGTVGRRDDGSPPDESTPFRHWDQASHYARSKWVGEQIARSWNGAGLDVVVVKPAAPVGAGDGSASRLPSPTGRRIWAALRGEKFTYPAGGVNHAPIRDIARGHLLAAERGEAGEAYILGHAAGNLDRAAFLRLVGARQVAPGTTSPDALTVNPRKAIVELGLPQSDLAAAFAEAVAYYRSNLPEEARERVVAP